mmetsp:Transcript_142836/g.456183  ORF Transcript_142836/g.456183 Transcript_142836/m.456183 type:complete len:286 (-) Transcript_142836:14-871(-)
MVQLALQQLLLIGCLGIFESLHNRFHVTVALTSIQAFLVQRIGARQYFGDGLLMLQCRADRVFPHAVAAQRRCDASRDILALLDALQVKLLMLLDPLRVVHPAHLLGTELRTQDFALALALRLVLRGDLTQLRGRGLDFFGPLICHLLQILGQLRQIQTFVALHIACDSLLFRRGEAFYLGLAGNGLLLQCLNVLFVLLGDGAGELGEFQRVIRACQRVLLLKGHEVALPGRCLLNRLMALDCSRIPLGKPLLNGLESLWEGSHRDGTTRERGTRAASECALGNG